MSVRKDSLPRLTACAQSENREFLCCIENGNLPFALAYHRLGLSIFPTKPRTKEPAIPTWKPWQKQRADEDQVRQWFSDTDADQVGIAVVCGSVSGGLLVRDFDQKAAYASWQAANKALACTIPTVYTSRGLHVYGRCGSLAAGPFVINYGDGELRGNNHYVLAPPSIHPNGSRYSWLTIPIEIPVVDPVAFGLPSTPTNATQEIRVSVLHGLGLSADVVQAIRETVPHEHGQRHRQLFQFARKLRSLSQYQDCTDPWRLRSLVEAWHTVALPTIRTKDLDTTLNEFVRGWPLVRYASGEGSLQAALQRAQSKALPPEADGFDAEKSLLLALCRELQIERSPRCFYLGCRDAAAAIGLEDHTTAFRWLKEFCKAGLLKQESSGSQVRRRANEYRYLGSMT